MNYLSQKEECLGRGRLGKVSRNKEIIKRSFVKCGISHNLDGAEDSDINIEGIPDYKLPQPDREFEMDDSSGEDFARI